VVVTPEVVFVWVPIVGLVTVKVTVQLPRAGIVIPEKLSAVAPPPIAAGVVPAQVPPTTPPKALMFTRVSVKEPPVRAALLLLLSVKVTTEFAPGRIALGLNALAMVGRFPTVSVAVLLAVPGTGVCVVVTPEVVFGWIPGVPLVTLNVTVHPLLAGIAIFEKLSAVAPAARVFGVVPTQVPPTAPPTAVM
jgi:hypothetical protein